MRKSIILLWVLSSVCFSSLLKAQSVKEYEYWIDSHTETAVRGSVDGDALNLDVDMAALSAGIHTFSLRLRDSEDRWSIPYTNLFYRVLPPMGQTATEYEYWTDHCVAGRRSGTVTNGGVNLDIDVSSLPAGIHTLSMRFRDSGGAWSVPHTSLFYSMSVPKEYEVSAYEYCIDDNVDKRTVVDTGGNGVIKFDIDASALSSGMHKLTLRLRDTDGQWSTPYMQYFYHSMPPQQTAVAHVEYYLDDNTDSRHRVSMDGAEAFDANLDVDGLTDGLHRLFVRVQSTDSVWSVPYCRLFYKQGVARIDGYECWFNHDYDNRIFESVAPVEVYDMKNVHIDVTPVWNTSGEGDSEEQANVFHIRFRNTRGQWSKVLSHVFTKGQLQMDLADYEILKSFFLATGGADWKSPWDISSSEIYADQWDGVSFKGGKVYDINLADNNLVGTLPADVFTLTELEHLKLSDNKLRGHVDSLFAVPEESGVSALLTSVDLSRNELQGEVSAFSRAVPELRWLDLSGNRLSGMDGELSPALSYVDLSNQFVAYIDELTGVPSPVRNAATHIVSLGEQMDIPLTTLQMYGFGEGEDGIVAKPDLLIMDKTGDTRLHLRYDADAGTYGCRFDREWRHDIGDTLVLCQQNGPAAGTVQNVLLDFAPGDANIDCTVDVLDVQHSLNYILADAEGALLPFNFTAADTYTDGAVTVQDIVRTVALVLDGPQTVSAPSRCYAHRAADEASARLFVQNGHLVLDTHIPVAAIDVTIEDAREGEVRALVASHGFAVVCRQSESRLRMLIYSPSGNVFAAGRTELADVHSMGARVVDATLADADAHYVPVMYGGVANGLDVVDTNVGLDVNFANGKLLVRVPHGSGELTVEVMDMQGRVLAVETYSRPTAGSHAVDLPLSGRGVYMVKVSNGRQHKVLKIRK